MKNTKRNSFSFHDQAKEKKVSSFIIDICMGKSTNIFERDVLVLYGPASVATSCSPPKAQVVHVDHVDIYLKLKITINIIDKLISQFLSHFSVGSNFRITRFNIIQKAYKKEAMLFIVSH